MTPAIIYNQEAEEALVACALLFPQVVEEVGGFFKAEHFHLEQLRETWAAIANLYAAGKVVDVLVVSEQAGPALSQLGGLAYLAQLLSRVPSGANGTEYARIVTDYWKRRTLLEIGTVAVHDAYLSAQSNTDPSIPLSKAIAALDSLEAVTVEESVIFQADSFEEFYHEEEAFVEGGTTPNRVSTGYSFLDEKMGGWMRGVLNVLHGWAGFGKTSLLAQGSFLQAQRGLRVGVFQLEENHREWQRLGRNALMGVDPLYRRLYATGKTKAQIAQAREDDLQRLNADYAPAASQWPMAYSKSGFITLEALAREARQMARGLGGLDVIYIDNMNYIAKQSGNESYAIGMAAMQMASIGKELGAAVVLIVHDNKEAAQDNTPPTLNQIYMSKAIEHTARVIMVNHPDTEADYFQTALANWKARGETWLPVPYRYGIQKNNKGLAGDVLGEFIPAYQRHQARGEP